MDKIGRLSDRKEFGVKMKKNEEDLREIEDVRYGDFREREGRKRDNESSEEESSEEDEVRGKGKGTAVKNLDRRP